MGVVCEKCYRKNVSICVIILQDRKVKKFNLAISKFRQQQYENILPTKVGKPSRESAVHADMVSQGFANFIAKGDRLTTSRDVNPPETIWININETTYKDPAPKPLDELRQRLHFAWRNVPLETLWELIDSLSHHLENVRKHKGRHFGY